MSFLTVNYLRFPSDLFVYCEEPRMLVDEGGKRVGFKLNKDIYLDFDTSKENLRFVMDILMPIMKRYKAKSIVDNIRQDRLAFVLINGYTLYFAIDIFSYKYIYMNYFVKEWKIGTQDSGIFHTGTLAYRYFQGEIDDNYLEDIKQYLFEESIRSL